MSPIIHMETDTVQALARNLRENMNQIQQVIQNLNSQVQGMPWQGPNREEFAGQFDAVQRAMNTQLDNAVLLSQDLDREVTQWLETDTSFATAAQSQSFALTNATNQLETNWQSMSLDNRKVWLKNWYENLCSDLGMTPTSFNIHDINDPAGMDARGGYSNGIWFGWFRSMNIDIDNVRDDNMQQVMGTVAHETRHQYQHFLVENPDQRPESISTDQINAWKENIENYKVAEDDFEAYRSQPIEQDARDASDQIVQEYIISSGGAI